MIVDWAGYVIRRVFGFSNERLLNYFDDLELEKVIPQLLSFAQGRAKAKDVVWIEAEEFETLKKTVATTEAPQAADRHLSVQALNGMDEDKVIESLNRFVGKSLMGESFERPDGHVDLLIPIVQNAASKVLAYVMVVGATKTLARSVMGRLTYDLSFMAKHVGFSLKHWRAERLSLKDDLTNLYNQKFLTVALETEIARSQRGGGKFTVLFMDIDYFKAVNDSMGHWVGSRLLAEVGRIVSQNIRRGDYPFRYGGDEFVVILSNTDSEGARVTAERLRALIEETDFLIDQRNIKLTLSIGLATYPDHAKTHKDIIKMADAAMYCGKNKSRNVVYVAS